MKAEIIWEDKSTRIHPLLVPLGGCRRASKNETRPLSRLGCIFLTPHLGMSVTKAFLVTIMVCICSLQPTSVYAQAVSAKAVVNGKLKIEFEKRGSCRRKGGFNRRGKNL